MAKATRRLSRARTSSKSTKPLLRLSPLGRQLLAAMIECRAHGWLDPNREKVSEELAEDERYQRAWKRIDDRLWSDLYHLKNAVLAAPLSLSNLADRALLQHYSYDTDEPLENYLPGGKRKHTDQGFSEFMPAIAAIVALSDVPRDLPGIFEDEGPPDAEARVLAMLGRHRPKRKALSSREQKEIADAAAAEAVAKAAAAVTAAPRDAPFFE